MRNRLLKWTMLAVLVMAPFVGAGDAWAQDIDEYAFFAAGFGQIFRFGVAAGGGLDPFVKSCHAEMSFADDEGNRLGVPPNPNKVVNLGPHQSAFFDLDPRALGLRFGQRINFRPVLTRFRDSGPCFASFEVYEPASGRTLAMAHPPNPNAPIDPPPHDGFPVGLAFGQTLLLAVNRLSTLDPAPPACIGESHFHAADGSIVGMLSFDLEPGHAAFLSLNSSRLGLGFGQRAGITPCVLPIRGVSNSTNGCKVSVQVLDNFTMWTTGMAAMN